MNALFNRLKKDEGFTLVELMVVVAIIGLLSAVAIPNFKKYQAKSKTSEAKLQLASIYSAETAFFSDYDNFASCLSLMGYDPSNEVGQRYYAMGFGATTATPDAAVTVNGAPAACATASVVTDTALGTSGSVTGYRAYGAGKKVAGSSMPGASVAATYAVNAAGDGFTAAAVGFIDAKYITLTTASTWQINENKFLKQNVQGY